MEEELIIGGIYSDANYNDTCFIVLEKKENTYYGCDVEHLSELSFSKKKIEELLKRKSSEELKYLNYWRLNKEKYQMKGNKVSDLHNGYIGKVNNHTPTT